jgi:uncharacterized protein YhhL (DUF1145 family)
LPLVSSLFALLSSLFSLLSFCPSGYLFLHALSLYLFRIHCKTDASIKGLQICNVIFYPLLSLSLSHHNFVLSILLITSSHIHAVRLFILKPTRPYKAFTYTWIIMFHCALGPSVFHLFAEDFSMENISRTNYG